ncbi:MAG: Crp/Fnr family transcriptional regulator [Chloroflexota bacterium]|nr:Crp/Fnr family transcriptional regulator [Chloroflexota bacterium]
MSAGATNRKIVPFEQRQGGLRPAGGPLTPERDDRVAGEARVLLLAWANFGERRELQPGQVLFLQGEAAGHIYLVSEGRVEAVHLSPDGRKFVSFEARRGDVLGEGALLEDAVYSCSAQAVAAATVIRLRGETVSALLREGGDFAASFAVALSRRLAQTEQRAGQLALGDLETRVAGVLLDESDKGAQTVALTHREIAERAGAARESVTEALNRFRREGVVELTRGAIRVASVARLAALARHDSLRVWLPLFKLLPPLAASAAMCATFVISGGPVAFWA